MLKRCLEMIMRQTRKPDEVIVVDDASTDDSSDVAREFGCKIIRLPYRRGAWRAKNFGLSVAQGNFLVFVDSDCILDERWIEEALKTMRIFDGVMGRCLPPSDLSLLSRLFLCPHLITLKSLSEWSGTLSTSNCMYKREVIEKCGPFDVNDDRGLTERARKLGYKLGLNPRCIAYHYSLYGDKAPTPWNYLIKTYKYGFGNPINPRRIIFYGIIPVILAIIIYLLPKFGLALLAITSIVYYWRYSSIIKESYLHVRFFAILVPIIAVLKNIAWTIGNVYSGFLRILKTIKRRSIGEI